MKYTEVVQNFTVSGIPNKFVIKEFEVGETVYVYKTKPKYVNGEDWDCSYYMHEAKILKKPIVCTDFNGADEQIENGTNGIIVPLNDAKALFGAISKLIMKPEIRASFSKQLETWSQGEVLREIIKHLE